jgi:hypothetical protein
MIARLAVIVLLVVVAVCLVTGIRVLMHNGWQRLASAVVWLSFALPRAWDVVARPADHVAAWLAVRSGKDAPVKKARRVRRSEPPAEFAPVPKPEGPDPAQARADEPSPAEVTLFDGPLIPDRNRPFVDGPPFCRLITTGSDTR